MIPEEFIREINERADLIDIIGGQVKLKRQGKNWIGLCPFHNEKTPSFSVNPERGFYHCFGCGAHGTAIGFLQRQQGLEFIPAVEKLAAMQGRDVPRAGGAPADSAAAARNRSERDSISALMTRAMKYFQAQLVECEEAKTYLKSRGLTGQTAKRYCIGYAPDGWDGLIKALTPDSDMELLKKAGLVRERDDGKVYDYFRHRVVFPIMDNDRVVGFGGRALSDANPPKYLNSSENSYFAKRRLLYGLPQALDAARQKKRLIICEGYMDVVMLAQGGFGESVATMGTAATADQMRRASRLTPNVYFAYDGDAAGQKGAYRALQGILPALKDGVSVSFLFLPQGHDPDSYIRDNGAAAFDRLLQDAMPLGDFFTQALARHSDAASAEGRATGAARAGGEMLRLLDARQAGGWRSVLQKKLEDSTGIPLAAVTTGAGAAHRRQPMSSKAAYRMLPQDILYQLLCCVSVKPDILGKLMQDLPLPTANAQDAEVVRELLEKLYWHIPTLDDADAVNDADELGEPSGDDEIDAPAFFERQGYERLANQIRASIKERYRHTNSADNLRQEVDLIVNNLEKKHKRLCKDGKRAWLEKMQSARPPAPAADSPSAH